MTVLDYWSYIFSPSVSVHLKICLMLSSVLCINYFFAYIVSIVLGVEQLSKYVLEFAGLEINTCPGSVMALCKEVSFFHLGLKSRRGFPT